MTDNPTGWNVYEGSPREVAPVDDLKPHISGEKCWCTPFWEDEILIHNSMDGREKYEQGRKLS
jgi:hypothetical protein